MNSGIRPNCWVLAPPDDLQTPRAQVPSPKMRLLLVLLLVRRAAPFSSVLRVSQHRVLEGDGSTRELRKTVGEIVRKSHKRELVNVYP